MSAKKYKKVGKEGLFDAEFAKQDLSFIGNPLEKISRVIDFEMFRQTLEDGLLNKPKKNNAGAKRYDVLILFKILILQRYYGLGDKQVEYQIIDRTSFKTFLGLSSGDKVPDEKTIWLFREELTKAGLIEKIFEQFITYLSEQSLIFNEGKIVDASFTVAPKQRNTKEENEIIKSGKGDELWQDKPNKKSHKDIDARWTKKNDETFYGYKNHAKVDSKSKIITDYVVTSAAVHDSQVIEELLNKDEDAGQPLYADSAYTGEKQAETIKQKGMINEVCTKGYRNKPLSDDEKKQNRKKSKTRSRVEHVFGFMEQSMQGLFLRSVGIARATGIIGLINLTYNIFRYEQIQRLQIL
jgi:IS5 family transposase